MPAQPYVGITLLGRARLGQAPLETVAVRVAGFLDTEQPAQVDEMRLGALAFVELEGWPAGRSLGDEVPGGHGLDDGLWWWRIIGG
jgi:hypothetical protein